MQTLYAMMFQIVQIQPYTPHCCQDVFFLVPPHLLVLVGHLSLVLLTLLCPLLRHVHPEILFGLENLFTDRTQDIKNDSKHVSLRKH